MTRYEFMQTLKDNLRGMSEEEENDLLQYYEEYFDEAGPEKEDEVIEELGSPAKLGVQLSGESAIRYLDETKIHDSSYKKAGQTKNNISKILLIVAALIVGSPVILPVVITAAALVFAAVVVVGALAGSAAIVLVAGVLAIITGALGNGLYGIGSSLIMSGIAILCILAIKKLTAIIQTAILKSGKQKLIREDRTNER